MVDFRVDGHILMCFMKLKLNLNCALRFSHLLYHVGIVGRDDGSLRSCGSSVMHDRCPVPAVATGRTAHADTAADNDDAHDERSNDEEDESANRQADS